MEIVTLSLIVSGIALIVAAIASLPSLSKFVIYHLYRPKLAIFFAPETGKEMDWSEMLERTILDGSRLNPTINIHSQTKRYLTAQIEFILDKPWQTSNGSFLIESGLKGGYPLEGGFWFKTRTISIPPYSTSGVSFPFEPKPEECKVEIVLHPNVRLSEFRLPTYFGEVRLKPAKKVYKILPTGD